MDNIYILVLMLRGTMEQIPVLVSSPQSAAMTLWGYNKVPRQKWGGILYKVNLAEVSVKKLKIPTIKFKVEE